MSDEKPHADEEIGKTENTDPQATETTDDSKAEIPQDPRLSHIHWCLGRNEDGDAQLYAEANGGLICHDPRLGRHFLWRLHHWDEDVSGHALVAVDEVTKNYEELKESLDSTIEGNKGTLEALKKRIGGLRSMSRKKRILERVSLPDQGICINGDEWDNDPYLLGCGNGVIDLRTGALSKGAPEQFIKTWTPIAYDEAAEPPARFLGFLNQVFAFVEAAPTPSDAQSEIEYQAKLKAHQTKAATYTQELVDYLQRLLGYCLIGEQTEHILVILDGKGRNGKSTLVDILSHVLGQYAGAIQSEMLLQQTRSSGSANASPDIMDLRGKRLVFASETSEGARMDTSKVKRLVGGDELVGRALYSNHMVRFKPGYTMFLLTNNKPVAPADDYAFWERIRVLSFKVSFVDSPDPGNPAEKPINKALPGRLKEEAGQILRWLVEGCLRYQAEGLVMPASMREARAEYINEVDVLGHFIDECCTVGEGLQIMANDLFLHYKSWCDASGHKAMSSTLFGKKIKKRFTDERKKNGTRYWGIDKNKYQKV